MTSMPLRRALPSAPPGQQGPRRPSALRITVIVIVLALVTALAGLGWATLGTDAVGRARAADLVSATREQWRRGEVDAVPEAGEVIAIIRSPRLGLEWPVVVGIAPEQLELGVGWYPQTGQPGLPGNFALAGLRVTHGSPFRHLVDLLPGDPIVLETPEATFTYRVKAPPAVVDTGPSGAWVLDPVPGDNRLPETALLTLTTAADLVATQRRAVVFAELVDQR